MACVSSPELRDSDLIAYLDEHSSDDVTRHLDRCEHCRENLRRLVAEENRLTALLYRTVCPPSETLGEYHLNMLSGETAAAVSNHVATCPHCTSELAQLDTFMGALESELGFDVLERIQVLVARLISGGGAAGGHMVPALAGLRGEEDTGAYVYEAGAVQIVIHVQEEHSKHKKILGFISGVDAEDADAVLSTEGKRIASTSVDELNNFVVSGLVPDTYDIVITTDDVEIHVQGVTV